MKKNIAILMGGYSSEFDISIKSGNVVYKHIDRNLYQPFRVHITKNAWYYVDENDEKHENIVIDKSSLEMLKGSQVDFSQELIGNSFKISNPKTKSSCGCGISFSF